MSKKSNCSKSRKKQNAIDHQRSSGVLPGWPGYRTREGRSGYDPIDTRTEAAHTAGTIIQRLFTGHFTNPSHVVLLGALGLVLFVPLVLGIFEAIGGHWLPWNAWLFLSVAGVAGFFILINFFLNVARMLGR